MHKVRSVMVVVVDENFAKTKQQKHGNPSSLADDRICIFWGFLPQMVSNECAEEKCEFYLRYHYSLQASHREKQSFP